MPASRWDFSVITLLNKYKSTLTQILTHLEISLGSKVALNCLSGFLRPPDLQAGQREKLSRPVHSLQPNYPPRRSVYNRELPLASEEAPPPLHNLSCQAAFSDNDSLGVPPPSLEQLVGLYGFMHRCISYGFHVTIWLSYAASPSNEQRKPGSNQSLENVLILLAL